MANASLWEVMGIEQSMENMLAEIDSLCVMRKLGRQTEELKFDR